MSIGFWQIAIVVILVVLLFGRGKISSLMGDVAKGIKSFKKGMSSDSIEDIRGVAFGTNTLEILMELNWVKPGGRKDVPGKPIQYVTTDDFLSHFNLQKLSDLPTVEELGLAGLIDTSSVEKSIFGTGKFYKEKQDEKNEDIYSNIDEMLHGTLTEDENS